MQRIVIARKVLAAFVLLSAATPALATGADGRNLTVVELFQSQGCSSCPAANANVMALSDRPDLLTLSFGVTYWDKLGWKDTFASPQYTARQWDYARAFRRDSVFTPELVVNGRADVVGQDRGELEALIRREAPGPNAPSISIGNDRIRIGSSNIPATDADVWLIRYDPRIEEAPIARGENEGRTLPHKSVVKEVLKLGSWLGKAETFAIPQTSRKDRREAVLILQGHGGVIIAATSS
jgi:hypothetical protein